MHFSVKMEASHDEWKYFTTSSSTHIKSNTNFLTNREGSYVSNIRHLHLKGSEFESCPHYRLSSLRLFVFSPKSPEANFGIISEDCTLSKHLHDLRNHTVKQLHSYCLTYVSEWMSLSKNVKRQSNNSNHPIQHPYTRDITVTGLSHCVRGLDW